MGDQSLEVIFLSLCMPCAIFLLFFQCPLVFILFFSNICNPREEHLRAVIRDFAHLKKKKPKVRITMDKNELPINGDMMKENM